VIAETRRLSAIELGICPGFGVSVITNGNKAPGGFGNYVFGTKQAKFFAFGDQNPGARLLRESR
jgi:hypothetical protein